MKGESSDFAFDVQVQAPELRSRGIAVPCASTVSRKSGLLPKGSTMFLGSGK